MICDIVFRWVKGCDYWCDTYSITIVLINDNYDDHHESMKDMHSLSTYAYLFSYRIDSDDNDDDSDDFFEIIHCNYLCLYIYNLYL